MPKRPSTRRFKSFLVVSVLAIASLALTAGSALASKSQQSVIEDPARLLSYDTHTQDRTLDEMDALGADIVKIPVRWGSLAPATPFGDLTNPDAYPPGVWNVTDHAIKGALNRGMKVWLMITAPAPAWATPRTSKPEPGAYKPDAEELGRFAQAVGTRYPNVTMFSIWNEPNLSRFLQPQYRRGVAVSATHYREMYTEAYDGLVKSGHRRSAILFGELLPRAPKPRRTNSTIPPLMWLRDFFCIDKNGTKLRGRTARSHGCSRFRKIKTSGFAYHPYTRPTGPTTKDKGKDNATIFYLKRVQRVLDQATKQRRVNKRKMRIYSSEFGFQSDPPDINMTRMSRIPAYLNLSEYLSYKDSRIATYSQYQIVDDYELGGFQSGLRFNDGVIKKNVYQAYQLPFNVFKYRGDRVIVWGALRSSPGGTQFADIQVKQGRDYKTIKRVRVTSRYGYFETKLSVRGANRKTFRLQWNELTSRSSRPAKYVRAARD